MRVSTGVLLAFCTWLPPVPALFVDRRSNGSLAFTAEAATHRPTLGRLRQVDGLKGLSNDSELGRLCQSINRPPSTRRHLYLRQILGWPRALKGQMAGHICSRLRQKSCLGPYTRYSWCRWQRMSHRGAGELGDGGWVLRY